MRCLVTGVTGFAGGHLCALLRDQQHEVYGTTRHPGPQQAQRLHLPDEHLLAADLADAERLVAIVRRLRPDCIFHLAAFTNPPASFIDPDAAYRSNLLGSLHLFAAVRTAAATARVVWVGSGDAYGRVEAEDLPVTERTLFRPLSPYAVSKAAGDLAAYQWAHAHGVHIVRLRPFNHTGPGQTPEFVCSSFAQQVAAIECGRQPPRIEVGNLDVGRDFSDVRDVVRAYVQAGEHGRPGEAYNVCSGTARTPREVLAALLRLSGVQAEIVVRPERQRRIDVPLVVGSAEKLRRAAGWAPQLGWEQTLRDLLDDWRRRLAVADH